MAPCRHCAIASKNQLKDSPSFETGDRTFGGGDRLGPVSSPVLGQGQGGAESAIIGAERHRLASVFQRLGSLSSGAIGFLYHGPGDVIVGVSEVRVETVGGEVFVDRLIVLPLKLKDLTEAQMGIDEMRIDPAGGAVCFDCPIQLPLPLKSKAEVVLKKGVVGLESSGLTECGRGRRVVLFDVEKDVAESVVGVGEVGLDLDRYSVLGDRFIELPLLAQKFAEIVVQGSVGGLDADGGDVLVLRLVQLLLDMQGNAKAEVRRGVFRPEADGFAVGRLGRHQDCLRFWQSALLFEALFRGSRGADRCPAADASGP